jgi:membrane protein YdbS with pleckstrin-like domain
MKKEGDSAFVLVISVCTLLVVGLVIAVVFYAVENRMIKLFTLGCGFLLTTIILLTVFPSPLPRYYFHRGEESHPEGDER